MQATINQKRAHTAAFFVLVFSILVITVYLINAANQRLITSNFGLLRVQDFTYHLILIDELWSNKIGSIYTLQSQIDGLTAYFGSVPSGVMPVGVGPVAILVWYPFTVALHLSPQLAYALCRPFMLNTSLRVAPGDALL